MHDFAFPAADRACGIQKLLRLARREVLGDQNVRARRIGEVAEQERDNQCPLAVIDASRT